MMPWIQSLRRMRSRFRASGTRSSPLACAALLALASASADAENLSGKGNETGPKARFLSPTTVDDGVRHREPCGRLRPGESCLARDDGSRAAAIPPGGGPWPQSQAPDNYTLEGNPNLRVQFVLERIEREELDWANRPAVPHGIYFAIHSPLQTVGGSIGTPVGTPYEGEVSIISEVIYDALVHDGCGIVPYYPIDFRARFAYHPDSEPFDEHDSNWFWFEGQQFDAHDPDTIQPLGVWNFRFERLLEPYATGATNFVFSGKVVATCTALDDLGSLAVGG